MRQPLFYPCCTANGLQRPGRKCQENFAKSLDKYTWQDYNADMTRKLGNRQGGILMNREEILERSRQENKNRDEMERDAMARAGQKACAVGGMLCAVIIILEAFFAKQVNMSTWAVYLSMTGTMLMVKYMHLKKKHELAFGLMQLALAAVFFIMYVIRLVR